MTPARTRASHLAIGASLIALVAGAARAQDDQTSSSVQTTRSSVGEVVVTARHYVPEGEQTATKTNIPLIQTPQSITVVTRDQIDLLDFVDAQQAVRYVAGVSGENYGPGPALRLHQRARLHAQAVHRRPGRAGDHHHLVERRGPLRLPVARPAQRPGVDPLRQRPSRRDLQRDQPARVLDLRRRAAGPLWLLQLRRDRRHGHRPDRALPRRAADGPLPRSRRRDRPHQRQASADLADRDAEARSERSLHRADVLPVRRAERRRRRLPPGLRHPAAQSQRHDPAQRQPGRSARQVRAQPGRDRLGLRARLLQQRAIPLQCEVERIPGEDADRLLSRRRPRQHHRPDHAGLLSHGQRVQLHLSRARRQLRRRQPPRRQLRHRPDQPEGAGRRRLSAGLQQRILRLRLPRLRGRRLQPGLPCDGPDQPRLSHPV